MTTEETRRHVGTHVGGHVDIDSVVGEVGHDVQVAVPGGSDDQRLTILNAKHEHRERGGGPKHVKPTSSARMKRTTATAHKSQQRGRALGGRRGKATRAANANTIRQGGNETHVRGRVNIGPVISKVGHDAQVAILGGNADRRRAILNTTYGTDIVMGEGPNGGPDQQVVRERSVRW